jgi:hypothetical protein
MKISNQYYDLLVESFNDVIDRMMATTSAEEKMYYFSAIFGTVNRIMNFECDPVLVLMHQELQLLHQNMSGRLVHQVNANNIEIYGTPNIFLDKLLEYTKSLKDATITKEDELIRKELQKIAVLSYATTGNGYFLFISGKLSL